ncbi:DHHC-type zinc finger protein [Plasmodium cynomolgi strain B]|uniref:DHHC-type zinc finger protein n=1 Tax=Plasmodium cynomolgi (strain B) TaxID=1120755 RepID=K6UJF5_PLACD|nr:DHHC-type zinc finger protein [Plasmodium cynomolgi strain B]GAB65898.1 DHHC-type zinc finger protein [Plasmodium cynomolgi strain B]
MKNPLPLAVVSIKLAVLATLAHLVRTGQLLDDGRSSFFFLYAASFLFYAISSLRDPYEPSRARRAQPSYLTSLLKTVSGYLKSCPLAYLPNDERAAFKASLSERTGEHGQRKDAPTAVSITHDEITSSDSLSSETVSTNGIYDSPHFPKCRRTRQPDHYPPQEPQHSHYREKNAEKTKGCHHSGRPPQPPRQPRPTR